MKLGYFFRLKLSFVFGKGLSCLIRLEVVVRIVRLKVEMIFLECDNEI